MLAVIFIDMIEMLSLISSLWADSELRVTVINNVTASNRRLKVQTVFPIFFQEVSEHESRPSSH